MKRFPLLLGLVALAACVTPVDPDPQSAFFGALSELCGRAYEGRVVSPPVEADRAFAGQRLVMHVSDCGEDEIRIPFHVGADRSRTWVIRRVGAGFELKHDHRHEDGSEDRLSQYGGATLSPGSASRQEFPADAFSQALFRRENIPPSATNVWALETHPGRTFAYELRRPGRFFRVEFDLARPVPPPAD